MKVYEKDKELYMTIYGKYKLQYMKAYESTVCESTVYEITVYENTVYESIVYESTIYS